MGVYDLEEAFKIIEDDLVNQIINGIKKTTPESVLKEDNIAVWRSNQLKELQEFKKRNKKYFTKDRKKALYKAIENSLEEVYKEAGSSQQKKILDAVKDGLKVHRSKSDEEITADFNGINDRKLNALMAETQKNLYAAETSAVRYAEDQYRQIIFNSNVYFNTGSGNLIKCIDMATRNFLEAGINNVEYKNGRRVNIQSYAEMALRTAEKRSYIQGEAKMRDEYGLGLVIVNRRGNACPKCMKFVGKIFNDDVYGSAPIDPRFPLLSEAIAGGLYHPNCKDVHTTYFEGITTEYPAPTKTEIENAEKQYLLEQQQRFNERQIRKYKRLADGTLDENEQKSYNDLVRKYQAKQRKLIEENPTLRRKYWRESVLGKVKPDTKTIEIPELPEEPKKPRKKKASPAAEKAAEEITKEARNFEFAELEKTMGKEDFAEFKKMIDENEYTYNIFNDLNKELSGIEFNNEIKSHYSQKYNTITYSFVDEEYIKQGMNKYGTLAHEYGHFVDRKGTKFLENKDFSFNEFNALEDFSRNDNISKQIFNIHFGDKKISLSDQYLDAMQKDIDLLSPKVFENKEVIKEFNQEQKEFWESLGLTYKPPTFRNQFIKDLFSDDSSSGLQDLLDGAFHREVTGLPWGHGDDYYNRAYNTFKKYKRNSGLKDVYKSLGYDVSNQSQVKEIMRKYETSSELWANQISALTVGGKELEWMEKYTPNTLKIIKDILK
jgi:hypothetical protein